MGSNGQDLVGDSLMHLLTSSSVTGLNVLKAGGADSGASLNEPEPEVGFFLRNELAEQFQRCDAIPSSMTARASWGHHYSQL